MNDSYKHKGQRKRLTETLQSKGITDSKVLEAINTIPRHFFFESGFFDHAYEDKAFPIDEGQTISQPYTVAFQTQLLNVKKGDKILEIGTGSGYQCAVLCALGAHVVSIERKKSLHIQAEKLLKQMGHEAILVYADGTKGLPEHAPYDGIVVTAAAPLVPESLLNQLKIGGHIVIPVGEKEEQQMLRITKTENDKFVKEQFGTFRFVPLIGDEGW